jgi:hypothetical protein
MCQAFKLGYSNLLQTNYFIICLTPRSCSLLSLCGVYDRNPTEPSHTNNSSGSSRQSCCISETCKSSCYIYRASNFDDSSSYICSFNLDSFTLPARHNWSLVLPQAPKLPSSHRPCPSCHPKVEFSPLMFRL